MDEWSIIELQGDLEVNSGEGLANKLLGDLHFTKEASQQQQKNTKRISFNKIKIIFFFFFFCLVNLKGTPMLIIGHHILYGKVVNLDKPLLVLKKNKNDKHIVETIDNNIEMLDNPTPNTEYLIQAIVKRKLLFNKRPRPIVVNDSKKI